MQADILPLLRQLGANAASAVAAKLARGEQSAGASTASAAHAVSPLAWSLA